MIFIYYRIEDIESANLANFHKFSKIGRTDQKCCLRPKLRMREEQNNGKVAIERGDFTHDEVNNKAKTQILTRRKCCPNVKNVCSIVFGRISCFTIKKCLRLKSISFNFGILCEM